MSRYFNFFPKIQATQNNFSHIVTNLLVRVSEIDTYRDNITVYYNYDIQDGDTPESIADRYYSDPEKHWVILYTNNIIDPYYDWPMNYLQFTNYIEDKYSAQGLANNQTGTAFAQSTPYEYLKVITSKDYESGNTTVNYYSVDHNQYLEITPQSNTFKLNDGRMVDYSVDKQIKYIYDYENDLNESKRTIKLLNREYLNQIYTELQRLLNVN